MAAVRLQANGLRDTTLGTDGLLFRAYAGNNTVANAVAVQADEKIILAGHAEPSPGAPPAFYVTRLFATGNVGDGSFASPLISFAGGPDFATAMALQPDGKIVLAGQATVSGAFQFAAARVLSNGSLDAAFGTGGKALVSVGGTADRANAVALQIPIGTVKSRVSAAMVKLRAELELSREEAS